MNRRDFLGCAGVALGATAVLPTPAIGQGRRELKMVTSWPPNSPGLGDSARRVAESIGTVTGGRVHVAVFGAGELVSAFEVFDAVSGGVADMYHSSEYYWEQHSPAYNFFAAVPFGFTANELSAWVRLGGGQELWDELSAQFKIKPFLTHNTGPQMGGWFTKEVSGPESFAGLRFRIPGIAAEVLRRLGAIIVQLPANDIIMALRSGALDASEWLGPWSDMDLGLHEVSRYYYYPAFHEPGTGGSTGINMRVWEGFTDEERRLIEMAVRAEYTRAVAEFSTNNARALAKLSQIPEIEIRPFEEGLLRALGSISGDVLAELGGTDPMTRRVYESYLSFRSSASKWSDVGERAFLNARALEYRYGRRG